MFELFPKKNKEETIEGAIEYVLCEMSNHAPDSEEYTNMVANLKTLKEAQGAVKPSSFPWKEIATGLFTVVGIGMIIGHERTDSITSKALGFVLKGRV
jgi:hypothetical protein